MTLGDIKYQNLTTFWNQILECCDKHREVYSGDYATTKAYLDDLLDIIEDTYEKLEVVNR